MISAKVLVHNRPVLSMPLLELVARCLRSQPWLEWSVLAYSNADRSLEQFATMLGPGKVHSLQTRLREELGTKVGSTDLDRMQTYGGSIYAAICTSKDEWGSRPLQRRRRSYQLGLVEATHRIYRQVLEAERPDFVLIAIPEQYDSIILLELCREMSITPAIYAHARTIGRSYFTDRLDEHLPPRAFQTKPSPDVRREAEDFVANFRNAHREAFRVPLRDPSLTIPTRIPRRPLGIRVGRTLSRSIRQALQLETKGDEPHLVDTYTLARILSLQFMREVSCARRIRSGLRDRFFDIKDGSDRLPEEFVFYPLQVSPEQSIDAQAPFFRDQVRAIDLLLLNLPASWFLVVKEHPAMAGKRRVALYRELRTRAPVLLADPAIPSRPLIERAKVTVSVTGTAALEAFLLGRPSLLLGRSFFSPWVGSASSFEGLRTDLLDASVTPPSDDSVVDLVSRVLSVGRAFVLYPPSGHELDPRGVMNEQNLSEMVIALIEHVRSVAAP